MMTLPAAKAMARKMRRKGVLLKDIAKAINDAGFVGPRRGKPIHASSISNWTKASKATKATKASKGRDPLKAIKSILEIQAMAAEDRLALIDLVIGAI